MTAIVGVLNSRAFTIAADSAVTVSGSNGKKVYNRSNKIFTLSKIHPVGIAIYSSADFLGIPLETIIKLYRQKLKEKSFDTIEEYKQDFLTFLRSLVADVAPQVKRDNFYAFCGQTYHPLVNSILKKIAELDIQGLNPDQIETQFDLFLNESIAEQRTRIDNFDKTNYIPKTIDEFAAFHQGQLSDITTYIQNKIAENKPDYTIKPASAHALQELFFHMINVEWIFEALSGLVFFGFGEKEIYPVTSQVLLGACICDLPRMRPMDEIKIVPGQSNSNIIPYAQADVTKTVLTGVDPIFINEMQTSIRNSFQNVADGLAPLLNDPAEQPNVTDFINEVSDELIKKLEEFQFNVITGPLLDILAHMGKEDMAELAESLVNITSIKRKFTSSDSTDESVGGPVDVAVVTKGDGFIWIKRKHYFNIENNPGFSEKYLKF
ncbi:hypothetical protein ACFJIV_33050 [Mucilaginibacter sp. UC70_90]